MDARRRRRHARGGSELRSLLSLAPPPIVPQLSPERNRFLRRFGGDGERFFHLDELTRVDLLDRRRVADLFERVLKPFLQAVKLRAKWNAGIEGHGASSMRS